jgi:hypothetical protein
VKKGEVIRGAIVAAKESLHLAVAHMAARAVMQSVVPVPVALQLSLSLMKVAPRSAMKIALAHVKPKPL